MKLFLIGTLLFSGGTAVAMTDEGVREEVKERYQKVRERVSERMQENVYAKLREEGFPYPSEERLENLTEDQQFEIISLIDQFNATYDWANMTDEEIKDAILACEDEIEALAEELGIELPEDPLQKQFRRRVRRRTKEVIKEHLIENLQENGLEYPKGKFFEELTEEQTAAITAKIDEINETFDWANMTEEEIMEALETVREEMKELNEEYGIFPPKERPHREHPEEPVEDPVEDPADENEDVV